MTHTHLIWAFVIMVLVLIGAGLGRVLWQTSYIADAVKMSMEATGADMHAQTVPVGNPDRVAVGFHTPKNGAES